MYCDLTKPAINQVRYISVMIATTSFLGGCIGDAIFWNQQAVTLGVTRQDSGSEAINVRLTVARKPDGESVSPEAMAAYVREHSDASSQTDANGRATLSLFSNSICGTPLVCDRLQDNVTGHEYLILIEAPDSTEVLDGIVAVGVNIIGEDFAVSTVLIGAPVPVG
ncbi:MAG: hypothetical protein A49_32430 [Methyloceanibacter sp.]|nr:MAG: hypothetical protein A49_32430 [Methyloceanibacter sp.]